MFISGFFSIEMKDGYISPFIGWAVTKDEKK
jgi:hypothetical protein